MDVDEKLVRDFISAIDSPAPAGRQKEQVLQDFLEEHTELVPTPNLLNHHLHFLSIVSKFPLGTELTTDYVYVTKSSDAWIITLVELESPDKDIFTADTRRTVASAAFNAALDQVRSWKQFLATHQDEVLRRLEPLLQPSQMRSNPMEFEYQLIVGRSANKNATAARKERVRLLQEETRVRIMTYDQLTDWYRNHQRFKKNVLQLSGVQYKFKQMAAGIGHMLSYLTPGQLALSPSETAELKASGYDMDAWKAGELLAVNGRHPLGSASGKVSELLDRTPPSGG